MRFFRFLTLIVSFAFPCVLLSQSTNASLTGIVDDPSKAVIPRVSITAINTQTGVKISAFTDRSGQYVLPSLSPGTYRIEVDKQGFKGIIEAGLVLHIQDVVQINFHMAVGSMSETVTVDADAQAIQMTGAVSTVIDHAFIENMPLNGNSLSTLFELTPGVVTNSVNGNNANPSEGGGLSVNGQRPTSNYLSIDGVNENVFIPSNTTQGANATGAGIPVSASGGTNGLLPTDAVEEYNIQTATYSAEYGRTPGGQIGIRTRGGTNEFHGSLFEQLRNQVMDATDWFDGYNQVSESPLRMNDFGGTLGGPLMKNRLFFFLAHETLLLAQPQQSSSQDVPSQSTRQTAASAFQPFLEALPLGNTVSAAGGCAESDPYCDPQSPGSDIYNSAASNLIKDHSSSVRIDGNLPHQMHIFFRFNDAPSDNRTTHSIAPNIQTSDILTTTAHLAISPNSNLVDEMTLGYSEARDVNSYILASIDGGNAAPFDQAVAAVTDPSKTSFSFSTSFNWPALQTGPSQKNSIRQWNLLDTLSSIVNRHSLKFGIDYLWKAPVLKPFDFSDNLYFGEGTLPYLETGVVPNLYYNQYFSNPAIRLRNLSLFANDDWKLTRKLVVDYGVRWELNPPPSAAAPGLLAVQGNLGNLYAITAAPTGTSLYRTVRTNFAPRLGFAYILSDNSRFGVVLRGGAGIFFDTGTAATIQQAAQLAYPYTGNGRLSSIPYSSINFTDLQASAPSLPQNSIYAVDPTIQAPRTYQWSLALEQHLGPESIATLTYVGNDGQKLINGIEENEVAGTGSSLVAPYGSLYLLTNDADSNYQALQLQLRSRLGKKLDALASCTWSHAIDSGDSDFGQTSAIAEFSSRGNSSNDIRQIVSSALHYSPDGFNNNRAAKAITGGWSFDTIALLQSAAPLSVTAEIFSIENETQYYQFNELANTVPGVASIIRDPTAPGGKRLNAAAFSAPSSPSNGDSTRNGYRLFGVTQWDMAVSRSWNLWREASVRLRIDAFNIMNIPNFADVNNQFNVNSLRTFGEARTTYAGQFNSAAGSGSLNAVFQNGGARDIQVSAAIHF